jgi:DnaJ-class molecular chaperone
VLLVVEVCFRCRGSGIDVLRMGEGHGAWPCPACNGSGYPVGYTPPTSEEISEWVKRESEETS